MNSYSLICVSYCHPWWKVCHIWIHTDKTIKQPCCIIWLYYIILHCVGCIIHWLIYQNYTIKSYWSHLKVRECRVMCLSHATKCGEMIHWSLLLGVALDKNKKAHDDTVCLGCGHFLYFLNTGMVLHTYRGIGNCGFLFASNSFNPLLFSFTSTGNLPYFCWIWFE